MKTAPDLTREMAQHLRCCCVDLGDERAVILCLKEANYLAGDIIALMDSAIDAARSLRAFDRGLL